jgi:hypothetical protein
VADAQGTPLKAGDFNFWNEVKQQSDQCDLVMRSIAYIDQRQLVLLMALPMV